MPSSPINPKAEFAKYLAAACVRRGFLENLHAGATPVPAVLENLRADYGIRSR
jgi:hypothetical protein